MDFFSKITVTCFAASYFVALILEISRLFFRAPVRWAVMFGFGVAGVFAHTVYIALQTNMSFTSNSPLSNWSVWCLVASLLLVVSYLWITFRQPNAQTGLFILPLVLALVGIARLMRQTPGFSESNAKSVWNTIHGSALLLGTVVIVLGFVMGLMYIVQARRLKQKKKKPTRFKLPSLEWLQRSTEQTLLTSTILLGFCVISGFVLNHINRENVNQTVGWSDPIVWSSLVMFGWLLTVTLISRFYKPARSGHKMAYLVFSCFFFLVLELALVLTAGHGSTVGQKGATEESAQAIDDALPPSSTVKSRIPSAENAV